MIKKGRLFSIAVASIVMASSVLCVSAKTVDMSTEEVPIMRSITNNQSGTTPTLPANIDGNQGIQIASISIGTTDNNKDVEAYLSNYTNGMTSVNISFTYKGSTYYYNNVSSGTNVSHKLRNITKTTTLVVKMSTNSSSCGKCDYSSE